MKQTLWKIKYYFKRLIGMDWKTFFVTVNVAKERSGKLWIVMFFDIIYCSIAYSAGYNDYIEFEFFLMNKEERKTYLTSPRSMAIAKKYNKMADAELVMDKAEFHNHYGQFISRGFLDLNKSNAKDLEVFLKNHDEVMFKVVDGNSGVGINKFVLSEHPDTDFDALYKQLIENKQFLIEEYFRQHPKMSELSSSSVNTIRMVTFIDDNKQSHLITAALKVGVGGYVDNIGQGGIYTILSDDGKVVVPFINQKGDHVSQHPITGKELLGFEVPNFTEVKKQIYKVSQVLPNIRYIGWDIAINEAGNLEIIEGNPFTGPFQLPASLATNKQGILPKLEKYMQNN